MCLYGDPAYPLRVHLQGPFQNPHLTPLMEAYNNSMSSVRVSVEWLFGDIVDYFKFMDLKKSQDRDEQHWKDVHCLCTSTKCLELLIWQQYFHIF